MCVGPLCAVLYRAAALRGRLQPVFGLLLRRFCDSVKARGLLHLQVALRCGGNVSKHNQPLRLQAGGGAAERRQWRRGYPLSGNILQ